MTNLLFAGIGIAATIAITASLSRWAWLRLFKGGPPLSYEQKMWAWCILGANVVPVLGGVASVLLVQRGVTDGYAAMAGLGIGLVFGAYPLWRSVVNCNYYFGEQYKDLGLEPPPCCVDHRTPK